MDYKRIPFGIFFASIYAIPYFRTNVYLERQGNKRGRGHCFENVVLYQGGVDRNQLCT